MENINIIRNRLIHLRGYLKRENISISSYLAAKKMSEVEFLSYIGVPKTFLESPFINDILLLIAPILDAPDLMITFNPAMESLEHDEINFYAPSLRLSFAYLSHEFKFMKTFEETNDEKNHTSVREVLFGQRENDILKLDFSYDLITDLAKQRERIISNRYPLDNVIIEASATSSKPDSKTAQANIYSQDFQANEFHHLLAQLYLFNFPSYYTLIYHKKGPNTTITDNFYLNNMNNNRDL